VCAYLVAAESRPAAAKTPDLQQRVTTLEEKVVRAATHSTEWSALHI
jgi:hypothetical protein